MEKHFFHSFEESFDQMDLISHDDKDAMNLLLCDKYYVEIFAIDKLDIKPCFIMDLFCWGSSVILTALKCVSSIFTYFFMIHIAKLIAVTEKTMSRNEENGRKS